MYLHGCLQYSYYTSQQKHINSNHKIQHEKTKTFNPQPLGFEVYF
jgi:hypothetical protein